MTKNQKVLAGVAITAIILLMLRKRIASALNTTAFASISNKLFNVISNFEGFYAVPYWDRTGYSVGYGSQYNWDQKRPVIKTDVIDKETAKKWLLLEAAQDFEYIKSKVKVKLTDNQILALSSLAYNIGKGAFSDSTLLELLNNGADMATVAAQFDKWVYSGGVISNGLKSRRKAEKTLFLS
jgi:lysozyme